MSRITCDFYRHGLRTAFCSHVAFCLVAKRLDRSCTPFGSMANNAFCELGVFDCWQASFESMAAAAFYPRDFCQLMDRR